MEITICKTFKTWQLIGTFNYSMSWKKIVLGVKLFIEKSPELEFDEWLSVEDATS